MRQLAPIPAAWLLLALLSTQNSALSTALASETPGVGLRSGAANVSTATGTLPVANGGTGQTTAGAAFDALAPLTTRGDMLYRNATTAARLAKGTAGQILQGDGNDPAWVSLSGDATIASGGALTLATVTVPKGGTGTTTLTGLLLGNGTAAFTGLTTSAGVAGALSDETGSGALVFATSPALVTPNIGAATATSVNGLTIGVSTGTFNPVTGVTMTGPAYSGTLCTATRLRRTNTQAVTNTSLTADNTLVIAVNAGQTYYFHYRGYFTGTTNGGLKIDFGGGSCTFTSFNAELTLINSTAGLARKTSTAATTSIGADTTDTVLEGCGLGVFVVNGAGTFAPRFAENTDSAGSITTNANSWLKTEEGP